MKWQLKVAIQAVLARVPGGEAVNHRLQRARGRHTPEAIRSRIDEAIDFLVSINPPLDLVDKSVVEVGTGWDGLHPIVLSVLGAKRIVTFDHVRHLRGDHALLVARELAAHPRLAELEALEPSARARVETLARCEDLGALLAAAGIEYIAPGDATKTGLPPASVHVFYSFAVLEHVSEKVVVGLLTEAKRVLAPGGVMVSVIGTGDHYISMDPTITQVNFLRYPEWLWAPLVKNKISYHNRLREKWFLDRFAEVGARVVWKESHLDERDVAAAAGMKVNQRFRGMTPEELAVWRSDSVIEFGA